MLRESELDLWMWAEGDWHLHPLQCVFSFHQCVRSPLLFVVTAFKLRSKDLRISTLLKFFCFIWIVSFFYSTTFQFSYFLCFIIVLVFYASVLFSYLLNFFLNVCPFPVIILCYLSFSYFMFYWKPLFYCFLLCLLCLIVFTCASLSYWLICCMFDYSCLFFNVSGLFFAHLFNSGSILCCLSV